MRGVGVFGAFRVVWGMRMARTSFGKITNAGILLAVFSVVSGALGLVRDRLLATRFGAGPELDAYFAAFRIPDTLYGILIAGGFSAVFIPLLAEYFETDHKEGWRFVHSVLRLFVVFFACLSLLLFLLMPWIMTLVVPGFPEASRALAVSLSRMLLVSPLLFGISSVFSGVLQYFQRFLLYAIAPVLYNLGIIGGILFLTPRFGIQGVVMGVLAGAFLHMAVQLPGVMNMGFHWRHWRQDASLSHPALLKIGRLAFPRLLSTSAQQITFVVFTSLASFFAPGSIAIFQFANNIQYLPVGVMGLSFSLASFPSLAKAAVRQHNGEFLAIFSKVTRQVFFSTGVAALCIFLFRDFIVRVFLQAGRFSSHDVRLTGAALGLFAFGIVLHALLSLVVRAFFALQDTKTPAFVHVVTLALNIAMALAFSRMLAVPGMLKESLTTWFGLEGIADVRVLALPLSLTFTAVVQYALLSACLKRKFAHGTNS